MRFESLALRNFKSYERTEVSFEEGVTVIHGVNGSGKSSLLEASFFALYGSDALVGTLDEVITTGEEESEIALAFTHDGQPYEISREIRIRGDRAQTTSCELETPTGSVSGARAVRNEVASLLRMDADAFLNCAYVRQGEVNKLIHAAPHERQDMIDELLQLGVLETYRDRATHARRGIASLRDEYAGQLEAIEDQIDRKEAAELTAQLNDLETQRDGLDERLDELDEQIEEAKATRDTASETLDRFEERREELDTLEADIEALEEEIAETVEEREACTARIGQLTEDRADLVEEIEQAQAALDVDVEDRDDVEAAREELREEDDALREQIEEIRIELHGHEQAAERAAERAEERRATADECEREAAERRDAIESDASTLQDRREKLSALRAERSELADAIEDAGFDDPAAVHDDVQATEGDLADRRDREQELRTRIETVTEEIEEMEALIEAGQCPTCGQAVTGAPAVEAIEEQRDRLADLESSLESVREHRAELETSLERLETLSDQVDRLERLEERIDTTEELVAENRDRLEERRETVDSLEDEVATAREEASTAEAKASAEREAAAEQRKRIAAVNESRETLRSKLDAIEALLEQYEDRASIEDEIATERDRRESLETLNDERRARLAEKRDHRRELADAIDEDRIASARASVERANAYLERAEEERADLRGQRDDILDRIGGVQSELQGLRELEERRAELDASRDAIANAYTEIDTLETLYGDLRRDLRERNVAALERMLNETFDLVYQNDAYERIELDGDYTFTVYQKDGSTLDPSLLSGGERALFNLSLRCAIYRLLSEGIEGTAPLPPLILDEPTVYLDAGHVGRLVELVEAMRSLGVEQIVLVSHDEELLRAADVVLSVEKDPTTNRSSVAAAPVGPEVVLQD